MTIWDKNKVLFIFYLRDKKIEKHVSYNTKIKTIWSLNVIFAKNIQFHRTNQMQAFFHSLKWQNKYKQ